MRAISIFLIASLLALVGSDAFALSTDAVGAPALEQETMQWRKVAESMPLGTKVKVQTLDGKRVSGTLLSVDEGSVRVKRNTRRPEAAVIVTFENIANMERNSGSGMHWGKALAIGLGAGGGVILTLFVIALQLD